MSEMVERVARAMFVADNEHEPLIADKALPKYRFFARAAIEAMREPTEAMIDAACEVDRYAEPDAAWGPMIDAALGSNR